MQTKGNEEYSKIENIRLVLFLMAYTIWMLRAFFKTTFFYEWPFCVWLEEHALLLTLLICVPITILDFRFRIKETVLLFFVTILFWIAYANGATGLAVAVILIYSARYVPFRKIAVWTVLVQGFLLSIVVVSSLTGVIENQLYIQGAGRERYALGFLYCSYASHYLLLFFMLYFVIRKRIRWYEVLLLLLLNSVGFKVTDTKTDILSIAVMLVAMLICLLMNKKKKLQQLGAWLSFVIPFVFWGISMLVASRFDVESPLHMKVNEILNGRLRLSYDAIQNYPVHWFGQKIKWVGGSARTKDPTLYYNYVDNNYISVTLQLGILFAFFMCLAYGRAIYIAIQKNQVSMAAGLFVFIVIGLVNPEMRNLLYNTFVLVLLKPADRFDDGWQHKKELK